MRRVIKRFLMLLLPIIVVLGILYSRESLIILFQQIGWVSIAQFFESPALENILIIALILVEASLFYFGQRAEERREKRRAKETRILSHYQGLEENVLTKWLSLSVTKLNHLEGFPRAMNSIYLDTRSSVGDQTNWHKWMMQHVDDKEGYTNLKRLFKKLGNLEKKHNNFVSSLLELLNNEANEVLIKFPNLKEYKNNMKNNFYFSRNVVHALHNPNKPLEPYDTELLIEGGTIAKSDDKSHLELQREIERIREIYNDDFNKVQKGIDKEEKILEQIYNIIKDIIYDLSVGKPLKGKCDVEHYLDSMK